jgi:hypothetical protein
MKVVDWISPERAEPLTESFGGMGGWFGAKPGGGWGAEHSWADYLERWKPEAHPYAEALRDSIVNGRIWEPGDWHQDHGFPLFEDGTTAAFSFRAWGDLLAAVWTEQLGRQYCYMDFYYSGTPAKPADFEARASMGVKR